MGSLASPLVNDKHWKDLTVKYSLTTHDKTQNVRIFYEKCVRTDVLFDKLQLTS
jgi:hypothetical protein